MKTNELSVVICGKAGQGVKTVEGLLNGIFTRAGYNVFSTKEYMSRIRGGMNSTEIRISSRRVRALVDRIDILVPLSGGAVNHVRSRLSERTLILGEAGSISGGEGAPGVFVEVPLSEMAKEIGGEEYANTIAVGVIAGACRCDEGPAAAFVKEHFSGKGQEVAGRNAAAFREGHRRGTSLRGEREISSPLEPSAAVAGEAVMNGTEGVALGALAGGCTFLSFYPMSPATGVATFMAQHADSFEIVVEQAEDEIAAINMALGAWYAGARSMVTTSGGGFALMAEGISLSGILETPVVIHLGQRPGPGTGLPTRTEQGDLLFSLFAGHGEFPRIILSPGSVEEAFYLSQDAFNLADRFQVPVIILTDQYLLDSCYNLSPPDTAGLEVKKQFVRTAKDYRRYAFTERGISPRGIPGHGEGLVVVDSDEHDQDGHITENLETRTRMVEKRLKKMESIRRECLQPSFHGDDDYRTLLLGWGSTHGAIMEALEETGSEGIGYLHFSQVWPLDSEVDGYLERAERTVVIENNATSQFGRLLSMTTGRRIDGRILKYNGLAFSKEEVIAALREERR